VQAKRIDQAYRKQIAKLGSHIGVEKDAIFPRIGAASMGRQSMKCGK
jgi:hypothetical protein